MVHLVRDLLDTLVVDRNGREIGRADGVVLEIRAGAPPRVDRIEIDASVLFARVAPFLGRWMSGLERALGIEGERPLRIPFSHLDVDAHITVDAVAGDTPAAAVESGLRSWLRGIPGG
jgi:hypothetical protein